MRARAVVAISLLLLPVVSEAQRLPSPRGVRLGGGRVGQPGLSGPQPRVVREALAYNRLRVSFEGYPMVTRFDAPGLNGPGSYGWTSFGSGTRAEYRLHRFAAATLDVTSSFYGGPVYTETAELGTRLGPRRSEHNIVPFVDARFGYVATRNANPFDVTFEAGAPAGPRYSSGFGGVAGAGVEFAVTRRFSVTTAATVGKSRMTTGRIDLAGPESRRYTLKSYRYIVALRFNPIRFNVQ